MRAPDPDAVASVDALAVLGAVLALHDAEDTEALLSVLPRVVAGLIPFESIDVVGDLAVRPQGRGGSAGDHRLAIRTSGAGRALLGLLLARRRPFTAREASIAALLGPHLGAAVDHVRLRSSHRVLVLERTLPGLTLRERQVLALVADGSRDRDIATALHIGPRTVEKHVEHIRAKLGARSRAEAVARWARATA